MWEHIVEFVKQYDINRVIQIMRSVDWHGVLTNPICIGLVLGVFLFAVYKKRLKMLVGILSLVALVFLIYMVTPRGNEYVPKEKIFMFIGGGISIAVLNVYLIFFRD